MNSDDFSLIAIKRHSSSTNKTTQLNTKVMLQVISIRFFLRLHTSAQRNVIFYKKDIMLTVITKSPRADEKEI